SDYARIIHHHRLSPRSTLLVLIVRAPWKLHDHGVALILEVVMDADGGCVVTIDRGCFQHAEEFLFDGRRMLFVAANLLHKRRMLVLGAPRIALPVSVTRHAIDRGTSIGPQVLYGVRRGRAHLVDVLRH